MVDEKLESMTIEELESVIHDCMAQRKVMKEFQKAASDILDRKRQASSAADKVAAMSDPERAALMQALRAQGVPSGEAFGKPGQGG